MTDRGKHKPATEFLKVPITSMDGRAIEECLNILNPTITVEAKGELLSMIRELGQLRIMVEIAKNTERDSYGPNHRQGDIPYKMLNRT